LRRSNRTEFDGRDILQYATYATYATPNATAGLEGKQQITTKEMKMIAEMGIVWFFAFPFFVSPWCLFLSFSLSPFLSSSYCLSEEKWKLKGPALHLPLFPSSINRFHRELRRASGSSSHQATSAEQADHNTPHRPQPHDHPCVSSAQKPSSPPRSTRTLSSTTRTRSASS
jgi:hypothetical protein